MNITLNWLKKYLKTKLNVHQIAEKLTSIGLEVESISSNEDNLNNFKICKVIKATKHPQADKLKICDVDIGDGKITKVVCGAPNARDGLMTVYASPGTIIPKNGMKLSIAKIRGIESFGMLCSESELNLSEESDGIIELKVKEKIGDNFFKQSLEPMIDISITPNRSDCLGVRGIARDLSASGAGLFIEPKLEKLKINSSKSIKVEIEKDSGCYQFGSCFIEGVQNRESPDWLKNFLKSVGQKPISAIVDITNYIMLDMNRPLHAYDADKISEKIIVRKSKKGESFQALDNKKYNLLDNHCVISDSSKILGLGGIIGGELSGTQFSSKNIILEAASFDPISISKSSKELGIITDAKYRFERGVDPNSIKDGLIKAAKLIKEICGGKVGEILISGKSLYKEKKINFNLDNFEKLIGFKILKSDAVKILQKLGFLVKDKKNILELIVPSFRPDISQEVDIIEELIRIKGYDNIPLSEPNKISFKNTLNYKQKIFHYIQRSIASLGYYETVTWSFTNSKVDDFFSDKKLRLVNPISSDLDSLRTSIFSNLLIHSKNNIDRDYKNLMLFEIGPVFHGFKPGEQKLVASGVRIGNKVEKSWKEKTETSSAFDAKADVLKVLIDLGIDSEKLVWDSKSNQSFHPGRSGSVYLGSNKGPLLACFGELNPIIISKLELDKYFPCGFEIYLDNIIEPKRKQKDIKGSYLVSKFQSVERDFAFIVDKNTKANDLILVIKNCDRSLIKNIDIFDVYEGSNIGENKKSIALSVKLQSMEKTLDEKSIEELSQKIISSVQSQTGGTIRSS
jgi:phenylalanyl-tRNA synthetase beta chain